jgi:hypothetical protein
VVAAAGLAALVLAASAAADHPTLRLTAADNAAAKAAVVQRADLGTTATWSGGATTPQFSGLQCANYQAKQSDLVVTGAAATTWKSGGLLEFDTQTNVLETAHMVALDWQRTVVAPQVVPCLKAELAKQLGSSGRVVSFGLVSFPKIATYARAYRAVIRAGSGTQALSLMVDAVLVGKGRTEISLVTTAPYADTKSVAAAELRLARLLAARARA